MFISSTQEHIYNAESSPETIECIGSRTTSIVAVDDIWSTTKEERLVVSSFEGTKYSTKKEGDHRMGCELMLTSNRYAD